jgi:hypothetical protein
MSLRLIGGSSYTDSLTPPVSSLPTRVGSGGPGVLPSAAAVRDHRYVRAVTLDAGRLSVVPAPSDEQPTFSMATARAALTSSANPSLQGLHSGSVFGFGLVSIDSSTPGDTTVVRRLPAWVGFAWGGASSCPAESATSTTSPASIPPSSGYTAAVVGAATGTPALVYTAAGSTCGSAPTGPTVSAATETLSVPWTPTGPVRHGKLTVSYTAPSCATLAKAGGQGNLRSGTFTLTVDVAVPFDRARCAGRAEHTTTVQLLPTHLPPGSPTPPTAGISLRHGTLGPAPQLQTTPVSHHASTSAGAVPTTSRASAPIGLAGRGGRHNGNLRATSRTCDCYDVGNHRQDTATPGRA